MALIDDDDPWDLLSLFAAFTGMRRGKRRAYSSDDIDSDDSDELDEAIAANFQNPKSGNLSTHCSYPNPNS